MNDLHELAALYVVDALTHDEQVAFEAHLLECADCRAEVTDLRLVTEQLSRSVEVDPPASLRASVLAGITRTAQDQSNPPAPAVSGGGAHRSAPTASSRPVVSHAPPSSTSASAPASRDDNVLPFRRRVTSRLPYLVAAASVLLALGFGGWAMQSRHDAQQASDRQAEVVQLLAASDVRTVTGTGPAGSSATVILSPARQQAVLVANGMPALPDGKVYEVWAVSGAPTPAGTFTPSGSTSLVTLPESAVSASQVAVTVEPTGGSDHPTTAVLMKVSLA